MKLPKLRPAPQSMELRARSLLDPRHMMLLRAALAEDDSAVEAYTKWRASEDIQEVDYTVYRVLPLLLMTLQRSGIDDPEARRLQGAAKHIWLTNMLRVQQISEAAQALRKAGIDFLVIKGGALFARYPHFAATRAAGDYDLQVRRKDAKRAINALMSSSFEPHGMRWELFTEPDFDLPIHAAAFSNSRGGGTLDLHWRPLPTLYDTAFVDELFAGATDMTLFGQAVAVPSLADHLFLAVARCDPWDITETFVRSIEVTQLLRSSHDSIDWDRFERLVSQHQVGWIAAHVLALVRDQLNVPMPHGLPERIWQAAGPANDIEFRLRRTPPEQRRRLSAWILAVIHHATPLMSQPAGWTQVAQRSIGQPAVVAQVLAGSLVDAPLSYHAHIKRLWRWHARQSTSHLDQTIFALGFSVAEEGGRWTDGNYAVVTHPVGDDAPPDVSIALTLVPFLPPGSSAFSFSLTAGFGIKRVTLSTTDPMPARLIVRCKVVPQSRSVTIAFELRNARSPIQIGHSEDPRLLGLFIQQIEVDNQPSQFLAATGSNILQKRL